ncbi:MAG: hypothetical protein HY841_14785 [Bacteroidetes bacterium]|nr:hypothetical protein [Bacteroidota bacterium]
MKNKILLPLAFAALLFSAPSNAQTISVLYKGQEIAVSQDTSAQLTLFAGRYVEGKTYLHWDVKNQKCNGMYIIYRSFDGATYEVLGQKQGIGVPIASPIAYYFQDENPCCEITYYKLVHIAIDKTYLVSEEIAVRGDESLLSQTKETINY